MAEWSGRWGEVVLKAFMAQYAASAGIIGAKVLKDAAIGALVDYVLQAGLNWAFFAEDDATFTQILSDVDLYQVGASAFENSFSSAIVSERTQMFISAGVSCIFDGSFENGKLRDDFDIQSCAIGVASAVIANKVSHFALEKISNLSADKIRRGLQRLGIEAEKWPDVLAWLGIRNADDVIASGFDRFRRYGDLIKRLDDLDKVTPGSKQSFLNDFANASDEVVEILGRRPELVDSWKGLINRSEWVRTNTDLLERIATKGDSYIAKVDELYGPTVMKLPPNLKPPNNPPGSFNGIEYDKFGFPKFESYVSDKSHVVKIAMDGSNHDYIRAYDKLKDIVGEGNIQFTNSYGSAFKIKKNGQWSEPYTWHHHQDGESMMPVLQTIHQSVQNYHTGGRSIINKGLKGLFDSPQF